MTHMPYLLHTILSLSETSTPQSNECPILVKAQPKPTLETKLEAVSNFSWFTHTNKLSHLTLWSIIGGISIMKNIVNTKKDKYEETTQYIERGKDLVLYLNMFIRRKQWSRGEVNRSH